MDMVEIFLKSPNVQIMPNTTGTPGFSVLPTALFMVVIAAGTDY